MDGWDGYAGSRDRILGSVDARDIRNLVVLTGDVHTNYAAELKANFDDPASATIGTSSSAPRSRPAATARTCRPTP